MPHKILESPRYAPYASNLFSEVLIPPSSPDTLPFRGCWITRNSVIEAKHSTNLDPNNSDIVILYLHGGGYFTSSPATYLLFLLRLAEVINQNDTGISIFALDYDLAPSARFPHQLKQARAAYDWLLSTVGIQRNKLFIMGDSAGGHLALSLLVDLQGSSSTISKQSAYSHPAAGLLLLSPWLSLHHKPESFSRNELTDVLTGPFLQRTAIRFLGPNSSYSPRDPRLEFLSPDPQVDWKAVLPRWVWVSAGRNEILYDDVVRWIVERGTDCPGESRINGEIDQNEAHVYAWLRTTDPLLRREFLKRKIGDEQSEDYAATGRIANAILERMKSIKEEDKLNQ